MIKDLVDKVKIGDKLVDGEGTVYVVDLLRRGLYPICAEGPDGLLQSFTRDGLVFDGAPDSQDNIVGHSPRKESQQEDDVTAGEPIVLPFAYLHTGVLHYVATQEEAEAGARAAVMQGFQYSPVLQVLKTATRGCDFKEV